MQHTAVQQRLRTEASARGQSWKTSRRRTQDVGHSPRIGDRALVEVVGDALVAESVAQTTVGSPLVGEEVHEGLRGEFTLRVLGRLVRHQR